MLTSSVPQWNAWRLQHREEPIDLRGADLREADLANANLINADLRGADLREANLIWATLRKANLREANLGRAYPTNANLINADLSGADLSEANLRRANLLLADLSEANLRKASLREANLGRACLINADLSGADLQEADLREANLANANLSGANLTSADLGRSCLINANLTGARGVDLRTAFLSEADPNAAIIAYRTLSPELVTENPTPFSTSRAERTRQHLQPIRVLYCYTPQDRRWRNQLETHLMVLKRLKQITLRLNREIPSGLDWKEVQDERFHQADLILLLVSPDFIASDYHYGIEMHHALEKHRAGNVWAIPILVRPTALWQQTPLGTLQVLPQNGKAITDHPKRDQVFAEIVRRIGEVASLLLLRKYPFLQVGNASKVTQALGPCCVSCGARNPPCVPVCENCGDVLF
jgi:uncharacterized protein YjbI with pentapeptide repeats